MDELKNFEAAIKRVNKACETVPTRAATVAVNFTKERFREQNWLDETPEAWKKRKKYGRSKRSDNRAVLVKSGRLMRSWRKIYANASRAAIGTDVPYAKAHNEGEKIQTVASIGSYQKKAYRRRASTRDRKGRTEKVKAHTVASHQVKAHRRNVNIQLPKRQMVGNSATLNNRIEEMIADVITKAITG